MMSSENENYKKIWNHDEFRTGATQILGRCFHSVGAEI